MSVRGAVLLFLFASQLYWAIRGFAALGRVLPEPGKRVPVFTAILALYGWLLFHNLSSLGRESTPVHLTWSQALLVAPMMVWIAASIVGFLVAILVTPVSLLGKWWRTRSEGPKLPERRHFLERTATLAVASPFVAGAYGLLYGRLNLETTEQPIRLARLPKAFDGFRIAQLSDIHIGPFMPAEEIKRYVAIANALKPDLIVLTGDFVTFDPKTQYAVVEALSAARAPYGVYGCLGNHDAWAGVQDSITALFRQAGVRILRGESVPLTSHGESINLIGVDFQSPHQFGPSPAVTNLLGNITGLVERDRVNILLSHNPDTFDRAAELGIDLSMAGHTHGGQVALEFISPEIAPSRLVTPYVAGMFEKPGSRLYVNRGIGTIFVPIRLGAPPEITVYKLLRA
jgi:predicted MPP superfamily phosphohydrolase